MTYGNQKKARNALLKHKAKMVGVKMGTYGKDDTFVTGGGVPGRMRTAQVEEPEEEERDFDFAEDKLLDDNERTERDFQEMMNNLNRMDNIMRSDDLRYIR